jgi:hypothetical protein
MSTDLSTPHMAPIEPAAVVPPLDYYVILHEPGGPPAGLHVEEFVLAADHTAIGVDSAGWAPGEAAWWSSAEFAVGIRRDGRLRSRLRPVSRTEAEAAYRALDGRDLPAEALLRTYFRDRHLLATAAPLRLGPDTPPPGFRQRRLYRTLFAGDLSPAALPRIAQGKRSVGGDVLELTVRGIGNGAAWCADLTVHLVTDSDAAVGPILHEIRTAMRGEGLIPVTVERFA